MNNHFILIYLLGAFFLIISTSILYHAGRLFLWRQDLKGGDAAYYNKKIPVEITYYDALVGKFRVSSNLNGEHFYAATHELFPRRTYGFNIRLGY